MDDIQQEYRQQLASITSLNVSNRIKVLLLENLSQHLKNLTELSRTPELQKSRLNCDNLSTSMSECPSVSYQAEKDVEDLEEKIIRMRLLKF